MNIFVLVKQVPDTETKIKLNADQTWIDTSSVKWILSPYDEFAVEEALRVREKNADSTVTVVSAGPSRVVDTIRTALAMGADSGIHIDTPETADNFLTAKALAAALKDQNPDLIFSGKEAIDDGASQVGQLVSETLGIPCVAIALEIEYLDGSLKVKREVEGGVLENIQTPLPCLIATQKGLNEPRYASLPNIMKAKKKEVKSLTLADLGVSEEEQKIKIKSMRLPDGKAAGRKLDGTIEEQARELVRLLKDEAKVL